ncbi:hypothetical protein QJS10_CPB21g00838 [Acorus calamus]|uniref:Uncharacterized protein n=1 Tax=Acorus calamus TaxID=4465 RepID=A0AAV9C4V9_ACOCL|nr:hypothetical protein QJS10_CPB21g00838 [Acorus calamus]
MSKQLFKAAQQGDVDELARTRDDVLEAKDLAENTALHVAVMAQQDAFAKDLCNRRPLLLMKENMEGNTPLHCALKSARGEDLFIFMMNVFLAQVRDPEVGRRGFKANKNGESLLYLAVDRESSKSVDLLLENGVVTPDSVGPNGWTALHAAVFRKNKGKISLCSQS